MSNTAEYWTKQKFWNGDIIWKADDKIASTW